LKELKLQELLRYALSGGVGLAAFAAAFPSVRLKIAGLEKLAEAALILGVALVLGSFIYSIHRALVYPLLYRFCLIVLVAFHVHRFETRLLLPYIPAPLEVRLDFSRWKREAHWATSGISEWGAQIHFLYCSAWSILAMVGLGKLLGSADPRFAKLTLVVALVSVGAAFLSNCRLAYYDSLVAREQSVSPAVAQE